MGTNQGDIVTEAPSAVHQPPSFSTDQFSIDPSRPKSLKRTRDLSPSSSVNLPSGSASPSKSARLTGHSRRTSRYASPNTNGEEDTRWNEDDVATREALDLEKERPSSKMASASLAVAQNRDTATLNAPDTAQPGHDRQRVAEVPSAITALQADRSKADLGSATSLGENGQVTTSPEAMDIDSHPTTKSPSSVLRSQNQDRLASSTSYPIPVPASVTSATTAGTTHPATSVPQRAATHSVNASQSTPNSPPTQSKKHKCQFCDVVFTRHHNLKSHLLTHSQEKPYECPTCHQRFRRLHDLKRHGKLHTGEKPHICPKCDRKFARGDALARHSKGAGGCAGRRHSLPGFAAAEEDYEGGNTAELDDQVGANASYDPSNEPEMSEEDKQRLTMANAYASAASAATHSQTFPPAGGRSGLYPPNTERSVSGAANAAQAVLASASLYAQNSMTESPKPLSPRGAGHQGTQAPSQSNVSGRSSTGLSLPPAQNNVGNQPAKHLMAGFATPSVTSSHSRQSIGTLADSAISLPSEQLRVFLLEFEKRMAVLEKERDTQTAQISQLRDEVTTLEKDKQTQAKQIAKLASEVAELQNLQMASAKEHAAVQGNKNTTP